MLLLFLEIPRALFMCQVNLLGQPIWPYSYECYARPGAGNLQIVEKILNQINSNDLFVINWTWIDRFDYYNSNYNGIPWTDWLTIMPVDSTEIAKIYYRDLHSEYRDKLTTLMSIRLVIDTLQQKNIPFIMTYMDELMFDQRWHVTPAVKDLQEYICPHMTTFEGQTFLEWSHANNYPISKTLHPLEEAHQAAGDCMIKVFNKERIK